MHRRRFQVVPKMPCRDLAAQDFVDMPLRCRATPVLALQTLEHQRRGHLDRRNRDYKVQLREFVQRLDMFPDASYARRSRVQEEWHIGAESQRDLAQPLG